MAEVVTMSTSFGRLPDFGDDILTKAESDGGKYLTSIESFESLNAYHYTPVYACYCNHS